MALPVFNYKDLSPTNMVRFARNGDLRWWIAFNRFCESSKKGIKLSKFFQANIYHQKVELWFYLEGKQYTKINQFFNILILLLTNSVQFAVSGDSQDRVAFNIGSSFQNSTLLQRAQCTVQIPKKHFATKSTVHSATFKIALCCKEHCAQCNF